MARSAPEKEDVPPGAAPCHCVSGLSAVPLRVPDRALHIVGFYVACLALIIHASWWLVWNGHRASLKILILECGYDSDPAAGRVAGGSMGPWVAPP